ncbi:MAG: RlmE family RNA methyltransferase [Methanophagales archaeon ANME-1-THS]|nr:MAG: RlmE family RNA methyltransferase [Methanophagales archaeon ANME-1-THS]
MVKRADLKRDGFYKAAKREGYRSRSAYKLLQIADKFEIIGRGDVVVDLGAAPGGWSQVARELVGERGLVISVDVHPIAKLGDVVILINDIANEEETITAIRVALAGKGRNAVDLVLSDASPQLSGNKDLDQFRSFELSASALAVASALLKKQGNFVAKIFQGSYYTQFYNQVKEKFRDTRAYSPAASRKRSSEVYVIGRGFR